MATNFINLITHTELQIQCTKKKKRKTSKIIRKILHLGIYLIYKNSKDKEKIFKEGTEKHLTHRRTRGNLADLSEIMRARREWVIYLKC